MHHIVLVDVGRPIDGGRLSIGYGINSTRGHAIYDSDSELSGSLSRSFIICECISDVRATPVGVKTHALQALLELRNHGVFYEHVLFVQVLDDEGLMVLAVDVDKHGFDGCVALDESSW